MEIFSISQRMMRVLETFLSPIESELIFISRVHFLKTSVCEVLVSPCLIDYNGQYVEKLSYDLRLHLPQNISVQILCFQTRHLRSCAVLGE